MNRSILPSSVILFLTSSALANNVKSRELTTERGGLQIAMTEKWVPGNEQDFKKTGKVILLVHGATWSSRCTFDPVPGFSLMDTLAEAGYDVFSLDIHGYGKSGRTDRDWSDAASAVDDVDAAVDYIRALRWVERVHVFGYQWGSQVAGMFAAAKPNKIGKLVLFGMRYRHIDRKTEPTEQYRTNSQATAMFKPDDGDLDQEFARRRAQVCATADPRSPNGALRDLNRPSAVDPTRLRHPVLLIMGDRDVEPALFADRLGFFRDLATRSKWLVVVPGLGKHAPVERGHARFDSAVFSFLNQ